MNRKTIKKTIKINAGSEKVFEVLTNDKLTRLWYAAFSEGAHAETDWKEGSKAIFKDNSGFGLIGKVIKHQPGQLLSVEYTGVLTDGNEDYGSKLAEQVIGGKEIYRLIQEDGTTTLDISADMSEDMYEAMSDMWQKALSKIKQLSENYQDLK